MKKTSPILAWAQSQPEYDSIQPEIKDFISRLIHATVFHADAKIEEQTKKIIAKTLETTQQQLDTIEDAVINALHTEKSLVEIQTIVESCIRDTVGTQMELPLSSETTNAVTRKPSYHSAEEIRILISTNIEEIRAYFGQREISFSTVCDHLQLYTVMREGDNQKVNNGPRWCQQVWNAINSKIWKECPIVAAGTRGRYTIKPAE